MKIDSNDSIMLQVDDSLLGLKIENHENLREQNAFVAMDEDIVEISDEARALLEAKMKEYGADSPEDLTAEEREDLKQAMIETKGVTDSDRTALAERAGDRPPPKGTEAAVGTRTERRGPPPKRQAGSSKSEDEIGDLKNEISDLEDEIEALRSKAVSDEKSKEELKSKQVELSLLESQLSLLEQSSTTQTG